MLKIVLAACAAASAVVLLAHILASNDYKKHRLYLFSMLGLMVTGPVGLGFRGVAVDKLSPWAFLGVTFAQAVFVALVLGTTTPSWRGVILDNLLRLTALGTIVFLAASQGRSDPLGSSEQIMMVAGLCVVGSGTLKLHMSKARADFAEAEARALQRFAIFHMVVGALWMAYELAPSVGVSIAMQIAICLTGVFSIQYLTRRTANKEFTPRRRPPKPRVAFDQYILTSIACLGTLAVAILRRDLPVALMTMAALCALALILRQVITVIEYEDLNNYSEANERRFGLLVRSASDVISLAEPSSYILRYVSPAVTKLLDQPPEDTVDQHASMVLGIDRDQAERALVNLAEGASPVRLEGSIDAKSVESIVSRAGEHLVITTRDVTERVALKAQLRQLAYHDPLTGLNNRRRFDELAREAVKTSPNAHVLLYIDLNKFKAINDDYGHAAGDQILVSVAERLRQALPENATLGRRGGDEFVASLPRRSDILPEEAARRVLNEVRAPYVTDFGTFTLGCAIGIAYPEHGALLDDMMRNADRAMYAAKRGDNPIVIYSPFLAQSPHAGSGSAENSQVVDHLPAQPPGNNRPAVVAPGETSSSQPGTAHDGTGQGNTARGNTAQGNTAQGTTDAGNKSTAEDTNDRARAISSGTATPESSPSHLASQPVSPNQPSLENQPSVESQPSLENQPSLESEPGGPGQPTPQGQPVQQDQTSAPVQPGPQRQPSPQSFFTH